MTIQELKNKIEKDKKKFGKIFITNGAFGDISPQCAGLVEFPILTPETGGTFIKFYGCSYLLKGNLEHNTTREIGLAKSMLSAIPREIIMQSFLLKSALFLLYFFAKNRFYHYLWIYSDILIKQTFVSELIPYERRNKMTKELERALEYSLNLNGFTYEYKEYHNNEANLGDIVRNFAKFIYFFLETDVAYRFPFQDIILLLNKENLEKSFKNEINRLFDILEDRADKENEYLLRKFVYLRKIILLLPKDLKVILKDFLLNLNLEDVKLDEDDWYFCLQRKYNYGGLTLKERIKIKEKVDNEKGHIVLEFNKKVG